MAKVVAKAAVGQGGPKVHLQVVHRIELLLRTMRVIERHEEQLCVVMTEIRSAGAVSPAAGKELRSLLAELPAEAYQADLYAVEEALGKVGSTRVGVKAAAKRQAVKAEAKARRA